MSKMQNLQQALSRSTGKAPIAPTSTPAVPVVERSSTTERTDNQRQSSRKGQVNISAWLDPNYKTSLRLVQARKGGTAPLQDLLAEALNDLFSKYDVPTFRQE